MSHLVNSVLFVVAGAAALGVYTVIWRKTAHRPMAAKLLMRVALPLLLIVPITLLFKFSAHVPYSETAATPPEMEGGSGYKKKAENPDTDDAKPATSTAKNGGGPGHHFETAEPMPGPAGEMKAESERLRAESERDKAQSETTRGLAPPPPASKPAVSAADPSQLLFELSDHHGRRLGHHILDLRWHRPRRWFRVRHGQGDYARTGRWYETWHRLDGRSEVRRGLRAHLQTSL